jgi:hypothetical protein
MSKVYHRTETDVSKKHDSKPEKLVRTAPTEFRAEHDDGSIFEFKTDTPEKCAAVCNTQPKGRVRVSGVNFDKNGKIIRDENGNP